MKTLTIALISGFALTTACGSGGSSGSSNPSSPSSAGSIAATPNANVQRLTASDFEDAFEQGVDSNGNGTASIRANGDTVQFVFEDGDLEDFRVNGTSVQESSVSGSSSSSFFAPSEASLITYYGSDGPSVIYRSELLLEPGSGQSYVSAEGLANDYGVTNLTGVEYTVVQSNGSGGWNSQDYLDGTITFNPNSGSWNANFGQGGVMLDGQVQGYSVSGDAYFQGMTGVFEGHDLTEVIPLGGLPDNAALDRSTTGVFAGSDGDKAWGGTWEGYDFY